MRPQTTRRITRSLPGSRSLTIPLVLAVVAGVLALEAAVRTAPVADAAERSMTHGGRQRTYVVHDFGRGAPAPLVIVLHGGGGNAANAVKMTGFDRVATREGLVAVYPDGTARYASIPFLSWNAGHCCASAREANVDDVGFIAAIIDTLVASGRADASRVYVTGMSNGGMMTHRIGRELSRKVAAIAPVVGAVFGDEPPPQAPVPAFIVVGADDGNVLPAGGPLKVRAFFGGTFADRDLAPAIAQATYWARHNGCGEPKRTTTTASSTSAWTTCSSGAPVVFHSVAGNGHAWPGGEPGRDGADPPTRAFDASEEMWRFFRTQVRRR